MASLTDRQQEIKTRLDAGLGAREIAQELGITRNAVYQQISRLRKYGVLEPDYTPTGQPVRERQPGAEVLASLLNGVSQDGDECLASAGALALVQELRRTRDELEVMCRRISSIIPR
jgi:predicted ArsR family transcriptional regulator